MKQRPSIGRIAMRKPWMAWLLGLCLGACVQAPDPQEMLELERGLRQYGYRVVRVNDGNTIVIDLNDQRVFREVRLIGVRAPEYQKNFKEGGGNDAGAYLNELLFSRGVTGSEEDERKGVYVRLGFEGWRYGPLIDPKTMRPVKNAGIYPRGAVLNSNRQIEAYVYLEGRLINRLLIDSGYARVDTTADFSHKEEFLRAEERARALKVGLWMWNLKEKEKGGS